MTSRKPDRRGDGDRQRGANRRAKRETSPTTLAAPARAHLWIYLAPVLLFLLVGAVFSHVLQNDFINYDDFDYVTGNAHVQRGFAWENVKWAFTSFYASNWHPLTWLSHMLDCQLFGLQPWGHHLDSLLLHAVNTCLVFSVLWKMTGAVGKSVFVAALFGIHPLHVESVAWAAERKDVLSTAFWLASLWMYVRFSQEAEPRMVRRKVFYWLAWFLLALGLMCKQMLVTAPCLMLLLDYWPLQRWGKTTTRILVWEKVPFFLICAIAGALASRAEASNMNLDAVNHLPLADRAENAVVSYAGYVGECFFPADLAVIYPYQTQLPLERVIFSGLGLLAITVVVVILRRRQPWLLAGWFWFLGTLVPVIGLVQIGSQAMDDRYTYLPSVGLFIMLAWGTEELTKGWRRQTAVLAGATAVVLLLCAGLTWRQIGCWKNSGTLFRHALLVTKNNYIAYANLGSYELNRGNLDEAVQLCRESVEIKPTWIKARNDLGLAFEYQGHLDEALEEYQQVVKLDPQLGQGYFNVGVIEEKRGQLDEAIQEFEAGLKLEPNLPQAHDELGKMLARQNRMDDAIAQFQEALKLNPSDKTAKQALAVAQKIRDPLIQIK